MARWESNNFIYGIHKVFDDKMKLTHVNILKIDKDFGDAYYIYTLKSIPEAIDWIDHKIREINEN